MAEIQDKEPIKLRFALRSKSKIIEKYNQSFYNILIESLKGHFALNPFMIPLSGKIRGYDSFEVNNLYQVDTKETFLIVDQKYNVMTLAYYPKEEKK